MCNDSKMKTFFTKKLIKWNIEVNKRIMPWKGEKDPYKIWISEIILQQTRVKQGVSYYNNFISTYPDLLTLASANDDAVFKTWEGLGYYTRCRNLLFTARYITDELKGKFPDSYEGLIALKGIGPYTAAAISSFAYGLPHAVADGNVFRVLARYFGEAIPVDSVMGKKHFSRLSNELLYKKDSAAFNQAIMDFGATVCKPQIAECQQCIFKSHCKAYDEGTVNKLPVKQKQLNRRKRWFTYFLFRINDTLLVKKRQEKDIWESLWEFYLYETEKEWHWTPEEIDKMLIRQLGIKKFDLLNISKIFTQQLTHQDLQGHFILINLPEIPNALANYFPANRKDLESLTFPKFINQYLQTVSAES